MARLEEIRNGASVRGIASTQATQILSVDWIGDQAINVVYRDLNGTVAEAVLYRDDEHRLQVGGQWSTLVIRRRWCTAAPGDRGESNLARPDGRVAASWVTANGVLDFRPAVRHRPRYVCRASDSAR